MQNHSNTWPLYFHPGQYIPEEYSPIARSGDDLPEDNSLLLSSSPKVEPHRPSRPPNAWILFRVDRCKERKRVAPEILTQGELSKLLSQEWKDISPLVSKFPTCCFDADTTQVRRHYEVQAEIKKLEHNRRYPGASLAQIHASG